MSVFEGVLEEEYARSLRLTNLMEKELATLPKGSIRERNIAGHVYYYLNHREGEKVISDYIKAAELDNYRAKLAHRKELLSSIKEQKMSRRQIERALGRIPRDE